MKKRKPIEIIPKDFVPLKDGHACSNPDCLTYPDDEPCEVCGRVNGKQARRCELCHKPFSHDLPSSIKVCPEGTGCSNYKPLKVGRKRNG